MQQSGSGSGISPGQMSSNDSRSDTPPALPRYGGGRGRLLTGEPSSYLDELLGLYQVLPEAVPPERLHIPTAQEQSLSPFAHLKLPQQSAVAQLLHDLEAFAEPAAPLAQRSAGSAGSEGVERSSNSVDMNVEQVAQELGYALPSESLVENVPQDPSASGLPDSQLMTTEQLDRISEEIDNGTVIPTSSRQSTPPANPTQLSTIVESPWAVDERSAADTSLGVDASHSLIVNLASPDDTQPQDAARRSNSQILLEEQSIQEFQQETSVSKVSVELEPSFQLSNKSPSPHSGKSVSALEFDEMVAEVEQRPVTSGSMGVDDGAVSHDGDASHQQQREQPLGESATETDPDATSGDPPSAATNSSNVEGCDTRLPGQAPSELGLAHPATSPSRVATPPSPRPRRSPSANSQSQASVEELARSASSLAVGNMSALADLMRGVSGAGTEVGESMLSHASSEAPAWMRSMDQGSQYLDEENSFADDTEVEPSLKKTQSMHIKTSQSKRLSVGPNFIIERSRTLKRETGQPSHEPADTSTISDEARNKMVEEDRSKNEDGPSIFASPANSLSQENQGAPGRSWRDSFGSQGRAWSTEEGLRISAIHEDVGSVRESSMYVGSTKMLKDMVDELAADDDVLQAQGQPVGSVAEDVEGEEEEDQWVSAWETYVHSDGEESALSVDLHSTSPEKQMGHPHEKTEGAAQQASLWTSSVLESEVDEEEIRKSKLLKARTFTNTKSSSLVSTTTLKNMGKLSKSHNDRDQLKSKPPLSSRKPNKKTFGKELLAISRYPLKILKAFTRKRVQPAGSDESEEDEDGSRVKASAPSLQMSNSQGGRSRTARIVSKGMSRIRRLSALVIKDTEDYTALEKSFTDAELAKPVVLPLPRELTNLTPPHPGSLTKSLPGFWEPPTGWGDHVNGMDSFVFALWWSIRAQPKKSLKCFLAIFLQGLVAYFTITVTKDLFEEGGDLVKGMESLLYASMQLGALLVANSELKYRLALEIPAGGAFQPDTNLGIVKHVTHLPLRYVEFANDAEILAILNNDIKLMDEAITAFFETLSAGVVIILMFSVLGTFSIVLNVMVMSSLPVLAVYASYKSPHITYASSVKEQVYKKFFTFVQEVLEKGVSIRLLGLEQFVDEKLRLEKNDMQKGFVNLKIVNLQMKRGMDSMKAFTLVTIVAVGGLLLQSSEQKEADDEQSSSHLTVTFGQVMAFYTTISELFAVLGEFIKHFNVLQLSAPSLLTVTNRFLWLRAEKFGTQKHSEREGNITLTNCQFSVHKSRDERHSRYESWTEDKLDSETDSDDESDRLLLQAININITAGSKIQVVGRTGAGKSVLLKILTRLYQPTHGTVHIDGKNLNSLELGDIVTATEQYTTLFDMSIADNIRIGREDITNEDVERASRITNLIGTADAEWALEDGLDTQVGVRGSNINRGLQQRVLMARAIVRNTPILIMDEPVSAQDRANKRMIGANMANLKWTPGKRGAKEGEMLEEKDVTVIAVTHDMDFTEAWDQVMYLENGKIVDFGTRTMLEAQKGPYWRFRNMINAVWVDNGRWGLYAQALKDVWVLSGVSEELKEELCKKFQMRHCKKNSVLFHHGAPANSFYVIVAGSIHETFHGMKHKSAFQGALASPGAAHRKNAEFHTPGPLSPGLGLHPSAQSVSAPIQGVASRFKRTVTTVLSNVRADVSGRLAPPSENESFSLGLAHNPRISSYVAGMLNQSDFSYTAGANPVPVPRTKFQKQLSDGEHLGVNALHHHIEDTASGQPPEYHVVYQTSATATTDCMLMTISHKDFKEFMQQHVEKVAKPVISTVQMVHKFRAGALKGTWQLAAVPQSLVSKLEECMETKVYEPDETIYQEGESQPSIFCVVQGAVRVKWGQPPMKRPRILRTNSNNKRSPLFNLNVQAARKNRRGAPVMKQSVMRAGDSFGLESMLDGDKDGRINTLLSAAAVDPEMLKINEEVAETEGPDAKDAKTHKRIMTLRLGSPTFVSWVASDARIDRAVCDMLQRVNRLASPEWLANHWLFAGLRDDSRQRISRLFQPTVFDSESPLIAPALEETGPTYKRPRTRAFVVVYGTVKVLVEDAQGNQVLLTMQLHEGQMIDEAALAGISSPFHILWAVAQEKTVALVCRTAQLNTLLDTRIMGESRREITEVADNWEKFCSTWHLEDLYNYSPVIKESHISTLAMQFAQSTRVLKKGETVQGFEGQTPGRTNFVAPGPLVESVDGAARIGHVARPNEAAQEVLHPPPTESVSAQQHPVASTSDQGGGPISSNHSAADRAQDLEVPSDCKRDTQRGWSKDDVEAGAGNVWVGRNGIQSNVLENGTDSSKDLIEHEFSTVRQTRHDASDQSHKPSMFKSRQQLLRTPTALNIPSNPSVADVDTLDQPPLAVLVVKGELQARVGKETITAGPGKILVNTSAAHLLQLESYDMLNSVLNFDSDRRSVFARGQRRSVVSSMQSQADANPDDSASLLSSVTGPVVGMPIVGDHCVVAVCDLSCISIEAQAAAEELRQEYEDNMKKRLDLVKEGRKLQSEIASNEVRLGLRRKIHPSLLFRRAVWKLIEHIKAGSWKEIEIQHTTLQKDGEEDLKSLTYEAMVKQLATLKEELVKTQHEITDRIVTLHTIEKEWDAMGLFTMVPNGPKGEEDLSAARLERLRAMARTRRDTARSELGPKLQDAEGLWEMLKRPPQVRDKWRKMVKEAADNSVIVLTKLESEVVSLRIELEPHVRDVALSLKKVWDELKVDKEDRWPTLEPYVWKTGELKAGEVQIRVLRRTILDGARLSQAMGEEMQRAVEKERKRNETMQKKMKQDSTSAIKAANMEVEHKMSQLLKQAQLKAEEAKEAYDRGKRDAYESAKLESIAIAKVGDAQIDLKQKQANSNNKSVIVAASTNVTLSKAQDQVMKLKQLVAMAKEETEREQAVSKAALEKLAQVQAEQESQVAGDVSELEEVLRATQKQNQDALAALARAKEKEAEAERAMKEKEDLLLQAMNAHSKLKDVKLVREDSRIQEARSVLEEALANARATAQARLAQEQKQEEIAQEYHAALTNIQMTAKEQFMKGSTASSQSFSKGVLSRSATRLALIQSDFAAEEAKRLRQEEKQMKQVQKLAPAALKSKSRAKQLNLVSWRKTNIKKSNKGLIGMLADGPGDESNEDDDVRSNLLGDDETLDPNQVTDIEDDDDDDDDDDAGEDNNPEEDAEEDSNPEKEEAEREEEDARPQRDGSAVDCGHSRRSKGQGEEVAPEPLTQEQRSQRVQEMLDMYPPRKVSVQPVAEYIPEGMEELSVVNLNVALLGRLAKVETAKNQALSDLDAERARLEHVAAACVERMHTSGLQVGRGSSSADLPASAQRQASEASSQAGTDARSHYQLWADCNELCRRMGLTKKSVKECALHLDMSSMTRCTPEQLRDLESYLQQHLSVRGILESYGACTSLWKQLGMGSKEAEQSFKQLLMEDLRGPDQTARVTSHFNTVCAKLQVERKKVEDKKAEILGQCAQYLKELGLPKLMDEITTNAAASCTSRTVEQLAKERNRVRAWGKIQELDTKILAINDDLVTKMKTAEGEYRQSLKALSKARKDPIQAQQDELEARYGRAPGTSRPKSPRFYVKVAKRASNAIGMLRMAAALGGGGGAALGRGEGGGASQDGEPGARRFSMPDPGGPSGANRRASDDPMSRYQKPRDGPESGDVQSGAGAVVGTLQRASARKERPPRRMGGIGALDNAKSGRRHSMT